MKHIFISVTLALALSGAGYATSRAQTGTWKAYMAYSEVQDVRQGGSTLYVLASNNLYTYNTNDQSLRTYDKVNGLSDCDISRICWNQSARRLIIVYSDYNIDLLDESGNVTNISDYYNASITGDKTVYDIYMSGRYAYMSTGFGIMKIDMQRAEISDTYNLRFRVDNCYIEGGNIYASSSTNGLYSALLTDNLLDAGVWSRVGDYKSNEYTPDPALLATAQSLNPGGPKYNYFAYMRFKYGSLYTVGGGYSDYGDLPRPGMAQVLNPSTGEWTIYEDSLQQITGQVYQAASCIDVDPTDHAHVMVGARSGLYEFRDGRFVRMWNSANSELEDAAASSYTLILGGAFDSQGNFWFGNSSTNSQSLFEYTHDGNLVNSHNSNLMSGGKSLRRMRDFMFDSSGNIWFANANWRLPSTVYYNPSSDNAYVYSNFVNEDGTTLSFWYDNCVAEDASGNIWIGTQVGPLYIDRDDIGTSPSDMVFQQHKVPRNDGTGLADYLLSGVDIRCIAVDGGNRKWFGTAGNGVYLISADNNTEIYHFTSTNSPLLSDNVESVAINPSSGEVFFGTDRGLCSYMGGATATVDKMDKDVTYAYPNPVRPDYTGPITITGLTYDADVKIVTASGVLVAQGRSTGGSFIWDGTDLDGRRVASGVYMVQTATADGTKGTVCKIAVVN